jgi:hypothetical protein
VLKEKKMNDENQENEGPKGPVILTMPASLAVPGFGFLVVLNPDWRLTWQERKASSALSVWSRLFGCARRATSTHQKFFEWFRKKRDAESSFMVNPGSVQTAIPFKTASFRRKAKSIV